MLLAVVSAYYLGFQSSHYFLRTQLQKYILIARSLATLVLALLPILRTITLYCIDRATIPRCSHSIATRTNTFGDDNLFELIVCKDMGI